MAEVKDIPIEKIQVGKYSVRERVLDEELGELRASIRRVGIIVPLVVVAEQDKFVIVAGHRRFRAASLENLFVVPCIIKETTEAEATEVSFAENLFRKDLSPVELAAAIKDVLESTIMTVEEVAAAVHRAEHWVHRQIGMLSWPSDVLEEVHNQKLSVSAASNLALVTDSGYRVFLLRNAVEQGVTARVTAAWLQAWRAMQPPEQAITAEPVSEGSIRMPMVPQAPCIVCSEVFRTDELSHVPVCSQCIRTLRDIRPAR